MAIGGQIQTKYAWILYLCMLLTHLAVLRIWNNFWLERIINLSKWHFHSDLEESTEADKNFHLSTAPLDAYFHLPKKTIYFPQEITPEAFPVY